MHHKYRSRIKKNLNQRHRKYFNKIIKDNYPNQMKEMHIKVINITPSVLSDYIRLKLDITNKNMT